MKKTICLTVVTMLLLQVISATAAYAVGNNSEPSSSKPGVEKQINLTDAQKNELKQLYKKMFETKKQIIQKYQEYGVISKEQADRRIKRMEEMEKKMEQDGYKPGHMKGSHKHGKCRTGSAGEPDKANQEN